MIFVDRTITVRKGESRINEPIVVYRGDYELEVRFTILNSGFKFMSDTNMIESEKASYGQLAILTPYGGNIFSDIVRCNDGGVTFVLTAEMLNQIKEVGLYSFQIRLMDYNKESRVTIPPIEFGIEVREPIASEDHDNSVNNALVGYSIAKVVDPEKEKVVDTFDESGNYNKTKWETGDRISQGKLNKIEDAIYTINRKDKNYVVALDKRVTSNYNVLEHKKLDRGEKISIEMIDKNKGKIDQTYLSDELISQMSGGAAVNAVPADNSITVEKMAFPIIVGDKSYNLLDVSDDKIAYDWYIETSNGGLVSCESSWVGKLYATDYIEVLPNTTYSCTGQVYNIHGYNLNKETDGVIEADRVYDDRLTFITGSNTAYVRLTLYTADKNIAMVYEGDSYKGYASSTDGVLKNNVVSSENIQPKSLTRKHFKDGELLIPSKISPNLFDKNTVLKGLFIANSIGIPVPPIDGSSGWNASDWIRLKPNTKYIISYANQFSLYDSNKVLVKGFDVSQSSFIFETTENTEYMRISVRDENLDTLQIIEGEVLSTYKQYGRLIGPEQIDSNFVPGDKSYNLLDVSDDKIAYDWYIENSNGLLTLCISSWVGKLYATDYIEVLPNTTYSCTGQVYNIHGYNSNKETDGVIEPDTLYGDRLTFITGSNTAYVRLTLYTADKNIAMVYEGDSYKGYASPKEGVLRNNAVCSENIQPKSLTRGHFKDGELLIPSKTSPNLFDKNMVIKGLFIPSWTGIPTPPFDGSSGWNASDWIRLKPNTKYIISYANQFSLYDSNKVLVKGFDVSQSNFIFETTENTEYMRISVTDENLETLQIIEGEVLSTYKQYGRLIGPEQIDSSVTNVTVRYSVPDVFNIVEGETAEIFFDSILGVHDIKDYYFSLNGFGNLDIYNSNQRKMVITNPTVNDSCSGYITVYDKHYNMATNIPINVKVNPITNPVSPKNVLVIGDSLTGQYGTTMTELYRKITENGLTNLKLIGTRNWGEGINHEGRGGWRIGDYLQNREDNPFWSTSSNSVNFKDYCAKNGYSGIDYCIIHMNWNDNIKNAYNMYTQYKNIMTLISKDYPACKIAAVSLNSYSSKYVSQLNRWCESTKITAFDLADAYETLSKENVNWYYINMLSQFDVEYANVYSTAKVNTRSDEVEKVLVDHVHCSDVGYLQIADAYFRKLMQFVNE